MSHVLIPQINKIDAVHTLEGSNGNGNGKEPSPTMQIAVKGLRLFDTLASIFSTIWLIVGKHFCLPMSNPLDRRNTKYEYKIQITKIIL